METELPLEPPAVPETPPEEEKGADRPFGLTPEQTGEILTEIVVANNRVHKTHDDWIEAKKVAAEKKAAHEIAVSDLSLLISEATTPMPLFTKVGNDGTEADDSRTVPLSQALQGVSANILTKLAEAGLTTVGEMGDFTINGERLESIDGIGPESAEKIRNALDAFWSRRQAAGKPVNVTALL